MNPSHLASTLALVATTACMGLGGCSTQQLYGGAQAWQRTECQRMPDVLERRRCMDSNALSYEEYKKRAAAVANER